jgi:hypothetical protein
MMDLESLAGQHRQIDILKADQIIAAQIAETLHRYYTGHLWTVKASVEQGVVYIHNLNFSAVQGMVLHMSDLEKDPKMRLVKKAGGELMERYRVQRGKLTETLQDELDQRPADLRGDLVLTKDSVD